MKNTMLLPRPCRMIGIVALPFFVALFIAAIYYDFAFSFLATKAVEHSSALDFSNHNLTDEVAIGGGIISLFMIAFSRLRNEDEYVAYLRLKSLQWGVYANYAVFVLLTFLVYGDWYMNVLYYNITTILVLFIIIFNYQLYIKPRFSQSAAA